MARGMLALVAPLVLAGCVAVSMPTPVPAERPNVVGVVLSITSATGGDQTVQFTNKKRYLLEAARRNLGPVIAAGDLLLIGESQAGGWEVALWPSPGQPGCWEISGPFDEDGDSLVVSTGIPEVRIALSKAPGFRFPSDAKQRRGPFCVNASGQVTRLA